VSKPKPKYRKAQDYSPNPVVEYLRRPTFEEAVQEARKALEIAESGALRPMPLVHEGARAYPRSRGE
jgi:hypothetical protein